MVIRLPYLPFSVALAAALRQGLVNTAVQRLQKAITHTAMLYGGIQGIAGREALPEIAPLQLPCATNQFPELPRVSGV